MGLKGILYSRIKLIKGIYINEYWGLKFNILFYLNKYIFIFINQLNLLLTLLIYFIINLKYQYCCYYFFAKYFFPHCNYLINLRYQYCYELFISLQSPNFILVFLISLFNFLIIYIYLCLRDIIIAYSINTFFWINK